MTDAVQRAIMSPKWFKQVRASFPTLVAFVEQSRNNKVIVYERDITGKIRVACTKLKHDNIQPVPITDAIRTLFEVTQDETKNCTFPGLTDYATWEMGSDGKLHHGKYVLISLYCVVDIMLQIQNTYLFVCNTETRLVETLTVGCKSTLTLSQLAELCC
jgi:hypothetical protein